MYQYQLFVILAFPQVWNVCQARYALGFDTYGQCLSKCQADNEISEYKYITWKGGEDDG